MYRQRVVVVQDADFTFHFMDACKAGKTMKCMWMCNVMCNRCFTKIIHNFQWQYRKHIRHPSWFYGSG